MHGARLHVVRMTMPMEIGIERAGGRPDHRSPSMQRMACVWICRSIHVPPRAMFESFPIYAGGLQPRAGTAPPTVQTLVILTAPHGSGRVSTTFTVNRPQWGTPSTTTRATRRHAHRGRHLGVLVGGTIQVRRKPSAS